MELVKFGKLKEQSYTMKESLRALKTNIQFCGDDIRTLLVTSSVPNEGKSTVALDLARSLTESGKRVLFIDTDMRKSVLAGRLRASLASGGELCGLSHYLSGQRRLDEVLYGTQIQGLFMIFAGPSVPNPTEILEKKYFQELLNFGKEHFNYLMANKKDEIGISRGLAWTQVGGDTLQIEVNVMPGKGELMLTGQLGDVMKESAQAGITYIRSIASDYKVEPEFFQENDIHVHIPEGAVPKDGPSAGITMATAILSAIIKKPVRADLAMTGEITLRGRVLPIGGLKEKLLAAKYAKIKEVLVPAENKPDIQELDKEITDGLTITFVSSMKEVLNRALV